MKKYLKIAEIIKADIIKGNYVIGEKIPTIKQLSEMYHVNPQTISKATAFLTSLGYLTLKQGSGSVANMPVQSNKKMNYAMLVDKQRNILMNLNDLGNYHCKDLYLAFLMSTKENDLQSQFIVYDKEKKTVDQDFIHALEGIDGIIVQGTLPDCYYIALDKKNIPLVLINRNIPPAYKGKIGAVLISDKELINLVNYVISVGHRKILYSVSNDFEKNRLSELRYKIIEDACKNWSGNFEIEVRKFEFKLDDEHSYSEFNRLCQQGFSAAIAFNDISALALYSFIRKTGKNIPNDFSVAGFDDIAASQIADPPLTTIKVNRFQLIETAIDILERLIIPGENQKIVEIMPTNLEIRRSVYLKK